MVDVAGGGSQAFTLSQGQPLYFDWAPGERRMLTHIGGERLALLSLDGAETRLPGASGLFGAPQWSADGERLLYALRDGDGQRLIMVGVDGRLQKDVLAFDGQLSFSLSPDGRKIAYAVTTRPVPAASFGPLSVIDLATGESTRVSTHPALGFFWSPDSRSLIYLLPAAIGPQSPRASLVAAGEDELWLQWNLWNGTNSQELARFAPSATFLIDYLRFFDQYARSMTPWSPDSRAFVYAGGGEDGRTGIWVQHIIDDLSPVRISDGTYAAWSPR
jgi:TolB protein